MPHVVVEFSANLRGRADVPRLLRTVHDAALATGVFPRGGTRTRAEERTDYLIADGHPDNAFVHVTLRIGHGRDLEKPRRGGGGCGLVRCGPPVGRLSAVVPLSSPARGAAAALGVRGFSCWLRALLAVGRRRGPLACCVRAPVHVTCNALLLAA